LLSVYLEISAAGKRFLIVGSPRSKFPAGGRFGLVEDRR
jgi:hypothetical protein